MNVCFSVARMRALVWIAEHSVGALVMIMMGSTYGP